MVLKLFYFCCCKFSFNWFVNVVALTWISWRHFTFNDTVSGQSRWINHVEIGNQYFRRCWCLSRHIQQWILFVLSRVTSTKKKNELQNVRIIRIVSIKPWTWTWSAPLSIRIFCRIDRRSSETHVHFQAAGLFIIWRFFVCWWLLLCRFILFNLIICIIIWIKINVRQLEQKHIFRFTLRVF